MFVDEDSGFGDCGLLVLDTLHKMDSPQKGFCSGVGVGKFHKALQDLQHEFVAPPRGAHNTPEKIENLQLAIQENPTHRLYEEVAVLGASIIQQWKEWNGILEEPQRICHGDLKISNLHFDDQGEVCALLDLDTVAKMVYSVEMGDDGEVGAIQPGEDDPQKVILILVFLKHRSKDGCHKVLNSQKKRKIHTRRD